MTAGNPLGSTAVWDRDWPTLLTACSVCGSDDAEPVGVVGRFDGADDATLSLRCGTCSAVYLSPKPPGGEVRALCRTPALSQRWLRRLTRGLRDDARILAVDCDGGTHIRALSRVGPPTWTITGTERNSEEATRAIAEGLSVTCASLEEVSTADFGYDLILLPHSLETTSTPQAMLRSVRSLLADGGYAVVVVSNTRSQAFNAFGGRHWQGYRYPGTRQHFNDRAVRSLSASAGLEVRSLATMACGNVWLTSTANLLRDWALPVPLIQFVSGRWVVPATAAWVVERISLVLGRGSLLVAKLGKA
jgi:2-polyprenyl-3-methyl-5-hydroxy-6-metoxy-1,4-benzoquinol methylase